MANSIGRPDREKREKNERLMQEGKARFLSELDKQIQAMEELLGQLEGESGLQHARHFYRYAHTIKGSAPIFGFTSVGSVAESLAAQWEWTQTETADEASAAAALESARISKAGVMQLKMELLILRRQVQLAEQKELGIRLPNMAQNSRLLVIDDDDVLRAYLVSRLELDGYAVTGASSVAQAKQLLREETHDLILLDLMMHPESGYELFDFLKEDPTLKWIPLIVLSARSDVYDKVRCLMLGANDYVTKPFQYEELAARIYSLVSRTKSFEQLAFRDPLTGACNRRFFDHHIELELQRVARYPGPISLAFIDIDRFKRINDTYGHAVGDLVLQGLAHLLQTKLRSTDLLARFGGEEFVVLMPNTTGEQGVQLLNGILQLTHEQPIAQHEGQSFSITFSGGIAEWTPGLTIARWIALADETMYKAKQQGRDRVYLAGGSPELALPAVQEPRLKKVLIADDDSIVRSILAARLKQLPVHTEEAKDGGEAYGRLSGESFDLCILDGVMPVMDGFGVLDKLKSGSDEGSRRPRIVMLSGKKRDEDISRAFQLGADEYMSKPFSLVELEMKVKRLLDIP